MLARWSAVLLLPFTALAAATDSVRVGSSIDGGTVVATRQLVQPAGEGVYFGGRPVDLAMAPDGKHLYVKDNRGLVVIETAGWRLRQELRFPEGGGSMHGIAVSRDGARVFLTSAQRDLRIARVAPDGAASWDRKVDLPGPAGKGDSHACGIALSGDEETGYVALSRNNSLGIVDLKEGRLAAEIPVGIAPFDVALSPGGATVYVSNWGGRHPRPGERTAPSAGTPTLIDDRGVASSGTVSIVDLKQRRAVAEIEVGLHPSDLALSSGGDTLYVANANSDTVSVIDLAALRVRETIRVRPDRGLPFGSAPNALALSADGRTLWVCSGGNNALARVELSGAGGRSRVSGFVPAGWYPGAVTAGGESVYYASVKGSGSRAPGHDPQRWGVKQYWGSVHRLAVPPRGDSEALTARALEGARISDALAAAAPRRRSIRPVPIPARAGEPSLFEHVVYVIKENRTYDQVFGDLPQGDGDPRLCIFGREVTPNHHALAEQFVLLDNFYCNGVLSADGHSWATEGNVTDHLEKAFGGFTRSYTFGDDPLTYSSSGFIWDGVLRIGKSFRNYGEMDNAEPAPKGSFKQIYEDHVRKTGKFRFTQNIGIERLRRRSCPDYPGWNMEIPDVLRAEVFLKELQDYERKGGWPNLMIVFLPQDHTSGTTPGMPAPRAHVADNDLALGRIVEAVSKSRFWPKTCLFVIEDDPQDGFDHVDGHRSICLVASPYTRRGAVVSDFCNQTSVLHTIARILGMPPMNQLDAQAPVMASCFTGTTDLRSYTSLPNRVPLDELNPPLRALRGGARKWAEASLRQPFDKLDAADEDTLNRILWHAARGPAAPYPAHLAGAHGRGLRARNLRGE